MITKPDYELTSKINTLHPKDKALLKHVFVENLSKTTLMWIYKIRYSTLQNKLKRILTLLK
jgi:hypothetical protein